MNSMILRADEMTAEYPTDFEFRPGATGRIKIKPLWSCSACHHRTTQNQARRNGGKCHQCHAPLKKLEKAR